MDLTGAAGTPGSASKGRGRKASAVGRGVAVPGRGLGAKDITPVKLGAAPGSGAGGAGGSAFPSAGTATAPGAPAAAGPAAASGLGAAGGVVKKRGRPARAKAGGDGQDSGAEEAPDTSMPYRGTFTKDLSRLMYGFGDYENPIQETINVVEDILVEYVRETCCAALNEAARMGKLERDRASGVQKLKVDEKDILFLVRKDPKKYTRIRELLDMQLLIKEARRALDVDKISETDLDAGAGGAGAGAPGAEEDPGEELPDVPDEDIEVY